MHVHVADMPTRKKTNKKRRPPQRSFKRDKRFTTKKKRVDYCKRKGVKWLGKTASQFGIPFATIIAHHASKLI